MFAPSLEPPILISKVIPGYFISNRPSREGDKKEMRRYVVPAQIGPFGPMERQGSRTTRKKGSEPIWTWNSDSNRSGPIIYKEKRGAPGLPGAPKKEQRKAEMVFLLVYVRIYCSQLMARWRT
jgi:hypothetical protein